MREFLDHHVVLPSSQGCVHVRVVKLPEHVFPSAEFGVVRLTVVTLYGSGIKFPQEWFVHCVAPFAKNSAYTSFLPILTHASGDFQRPSLKNLNTPFLYGISSAAYLLHNSIKVSAAI